MFKPIKNIQGNIGIAIVIALIAVLSGVSLASVAFLDARGFRLQLDAVQEFHLLRSEVGRGRLLAGHFETLPTPPLHTVLPDRAVPVDFGSHRTVYNTRTKLDLFDDGFDSGFYIRSLITATRGEGSLLNPEHLSPVKRYGENRIMSLQTIALFHYFTNIDRSLDDRRGGIIFYGEDIIRGRVHSNSEIHINYTWSSRWPEFHGLVSTSEDIRVNPGSGRDFPEEEIFFGGLIENYPRIEFTPTADIARREGTRPFGDSEQEDMIAYVTVDGAAYETMLGEIVVEEPVQEWIEGYNQFTIYDSYPPYGPVGQEIGVNRIPKKDTLWSEGPGGTLRNQSAFVPMELWISGNFSGRQTWASSHDIYLKDDLTYTNTTPGQRPDGIDGDGNPTLTPNISDYLGIISEECIYIQYGHWDPIDSVRVRPNTEDIYMYGAYCALGESPHPWYDGVITLQYIHPKGSTPPQYSIGEFFQYIDLHLFHYPTSTLNPWPPGLDYPWYNPLWPEPGPIYQVDGLPNYTPNPHDAEPVVQHRGAIWLFGSIAQRRRGPVGQLSSGFLTRIWDIDNTIQPHNRPTYGGIPPGTTGYDKRYHEDLRFERSGPPHFPLVRFEGYESEELMDLGYETLSWVFKAPPSNF